MSEQAAGGTFSSDLIFDLGMHTGLDTRFYLDKGFRVVALEANPTLVERGHETFADALQAGRLHIVDRALWHGSESEVTFYINEKKDDWSSILKGNANREGTGVEEVRVKTLQLKELFSAFGVPYYIKCDLEGADEVFVDQLLAGPHRPAFASVEVAGQSGMRILAKLFAAGYDRMQIVNQALNAWTAAPDPALEGRFVDVKFNGHMSGLFGKELPRQNWTTFEQTITNYMDFFSLKERDPGLAHGWVDAHFTTSGSLEH